MRNYRSVVRLCIGGQGMLKPPKTQAALAHGPRRTSTPAGAAIGPAAMRDLLRKKGGQRPLPFSIRVCQVQYMM
jgi:hypothetical protein